MNEKLTKARKQNMKLYSIYRAISLDLIFYYAIEYLFLTEAKGLSSSAVMLGGAFYATFMIFLQIPGSVVVDRLGTRKCTIIANLFNILFIILIMLTNTIGMLALAQFVSALCFALKNVSDKALLQFSIPEGKNKGEIYSKVEGKGTKNYYIINAVTSLLSGFLYVVTPYAPLVCSLMFAILSLIISLGFADIQKIKRKEKISAIKQTEEYIIELKDTLKYIVNSQRLRSLFLYSGISWGIYSLMNTYRSSLLVDMGLTPQYVTGVAAIVGIASAVGSKGQIEWHNTLKNKALSALLIILTFATIMAGIAGIMSVSIITIITAVLCFVLIFFAKGAYEVLVSRYLGNFTNEKVLTQIYAMDETFKNGSKAVIGFLGAYLLEITDAANSLILIGIMILIITCGLISYMKTRLGLKPEEYNGKEVIYK